MLADIKELKILRKRHNLTQSQLAKLAGVSQSLVAKVESGVIDPSYTNFRRLYEVLTGLQESNEPKARDLMTEKLITASRDSTLPDIIKKMKQHGISQLPVMERESIIGLVSETDVIEMLHEGRDVRKLKASDVMENVPPTVPVETPLRVVTELLRVSPLIVITDKGKAKGVITKADILNRLAK